MLRSSITAILVAAAPALALAQADVRSQHAKPASDSSLHATRPDWVKVGGELRARAESYDGGGFTPGNSDSYVLTRVLLDGHIRATRSLSFLVQMMDAEAPEKNTSPAGAPFRDHPDLRQAYMQLGADDAARTARAGRLELGFGDGRLVGALPWANTARTFDGALGTMSGAGYRLDAFAARVVKVDQNRFDRSVPGNNFYGAYGRFTNVLSGGALEPFFFWRRQSRVLTELGATGTMNFGTLGTRIAGRLPSDFDYDVQMAVQRGAVASEHIAAWAGHWQLGRRFASIPLTPRLFAEYNQASGDSNPADNRKNTFDQLYPTGHDKYGLTDLVGWQNMKHVRGGVAVPVAKGWTTSARWSEYWLADPHDALYTGGGAVIARRAAGNAGSYVGHELDVVASGRIAKLVDLSAGIGRLTPGEFLKNTTAGHAYTYPYVMVTYAF